MQEDIQSKHTKDLNSEGKPMGGNLVILENANGDREEPGALSEKDRELLKRPVIKNVLQ